MALLIDKVGPEDVAAEPFPHLVVQNALDDDLCDQLIAEFPPLDVVSQGEPLGSNKRFSLPARFALGNPAVAPVWQDVIAKHVSQEFLDGLVRLFGKHILDLYPSFEQDHGPLDSLRVGTRNVEEDKDADVRLDAQISINSPVLEQPNSVRESHLDAPNKLFIGLFYLRTKDDDSEGGNLEISRWKDSPRGLRGRMAYRTFSEIVRTVPYARNTLILFVNSPLSLHGVTVRTRTQAPRLFINLLGDVKAPLFDLDTYQATRRDKALASPEIIKGKLAGAR